MFFALLIIHFILIALRRAALCLFLWVLLFPNRKNRALIDICQIFEDKIMVELLSDDA